MHNNIGGGRDGTRMRGRETGNDESECDLRDLEGARRSERGGENRGASHHGSLFSFLPFTEAKDQVRRTDHTRIFAHGGGFEPDRNHRSCRCR